MACAAATVFGIAQPNGVFECLVSNPGKVITVDKTCLVGFAGLTGTSSLMR